jgi:hypothetical protein
MLTLLFYCTGFCSIIICSFTKHNIYVFKALITLLISILIIISISQDVGGDLVRYERKFYGMRIADIEWSRWVADQIQLLLKWIFNETTYEPMPLKREQDYLYSMHIYNQIDHYSFKFYQIITNLVYIAGTFSFVNSTSYRNNNISKFLILLLPVSMTFITISIEQSLSLGVVFFALSIIQKNKLGFLLLVILSGFIHWSSWIFLPLVFYDRRLFRNLLILSLTFTLLLQIFNVNLVPFVVNTLTTLSNDLGVNFFDVFTTNIQNSVNIKQERVISWHHIYLNTFLVFCAVFFHMRFRNSLNFQDRKNSILLVSTLIFLLILSLIFKDVDNYVVRIGAMIKIISLICFVNTVYIINRYTGVINILLGINLTILGVYSFY